MDGFLHDENTEVARF